MDDALRFQFDIDGIDWPELQRLFEVADMHGREADKLHRAFKCSGVVVFAFEAAQLIGAARAITDNEYHAVIYDVVVHPARQRRGVGKRMMTELLSRLSVWRILLVAEGEVTYFYRQQGFESFANVMARFDRSRLYDTPRD